MKKFGLIIATVVAAGIVVPSMASAETIVIKHRDHGPRAEMMRHRDHGFRHHDRKIVVIKKSHHRY
ncbi:hypothetical protein BH11PSE4_BH11PSE4_03880 [soil metagenome]